MPLTEEQRNLRAVMFPGKRGKLEKSDQKVFAQACAEQGFPLDETRKPAGRRGPKRVTYKEATSSDEGNDEGSDSDEAELEELADQDKEENGRGARNKRVKQEADADSDDDEPVPALPSSGPASAARQRRSTTGRKGGRPSAADTAAKALIGLTSSLSPLPATAAAAKAAAGRQRIAAALPAVGFKPFAGSALRAGGGRAGVAGQQYEAPYDYYDVYQTYLSCMDLYSRAVGRLGVDAVAAPIPPEELLGPSYASHLSTDNRAPHWTPPAADAAGAAAEARQTSAQPTGRPTRTSAAAAAAAPEAAVTEVETSRRGGRGKRRAADVEQPAAKRPNHGRSSVPSRAAAAGTSDDESDEDADDQQEEGGGQQLGVASGAALPSQAKGDAQQQADRSRSGSPAVPAANGRAGHTASAAADVEDNSSSDMDVGVAAAHGDAAGTAANGDRAEAAAQGLNENGSDLHAEHPIAVQANGRAVHQHASIDFERKTAANSGNGSNGKHRAGQEAGLATGLTENGGSGNDSESSGGAGQHDRTSSEVTDLEQQVAGGPAAPGSSEGHENPITVGQRSTGQEIKVV